MTVTILLISLFLLILIGVPVAFAIGMSTLLTILLATNLNSSLLIQQSFTALDSFSLLAVPLFILAGTIMQQGGLAERLLDFANTLVGFITGGLAMITVLSSMFFASISGSGPATVSAIGSFMVPSMIEKGYSKRFAAGIVAVSGTIGAIIPPSISFVILGVVGSISIGELFLGGIIPGVFIGICLMIGAYFISKKENYPSEGKPPSFKDVLKAFNRAKFGLLIPVIVLGGIYGGFFSPTESAAVAAIYAIIVSLFFNKSSFSLKDLYKTFVESALTNVVVSIVIGFSISFAYLLSIERVPQQIASFIIGFSSNYFVILLIIFGILLITGMFIDTIPAILILTPIFLPIVTEIGMDPIHFGVFMVCSLAIGFATPPLGISLFLTAGFANIDLEESIMGALPFLIIMIFATIIIMFVPTMSTLIPSMVDL